MILNKKPMAERFRSKQHVVKEVVWLIEQEAGAYQVSAVLGVIGPVDAWLRLRVFGDGDLWC